MHGILDRAAAASVTALPSNVVRIQTDGFDTNRPEHIMYLGTQRRDRYLRYVGAAVYYRCDPPPAAVAWLANPDGTTRDNPAFLHFPNDANGTGGFDSAGGEVAPGAATASNPRGGSWFRLEPVMGENDLFQWGGIHSTYGDFETGALANWFAINDYKNFRASEWYHPNSVLFVPSGWFAVAKPIIGKEGTLHLTGKREARDGAKSCLAFKDTHESFIIHYDNTGGETTLTQRQERADNPNSDRRSGAFTILNGFGIFNQATISKDYRANADMILLRARASIMNMWLSGAPRHGVNIATSISAANENPKGVGNDFEAGNANSARVCFNSIQFPGGVGVRNIGADSNAILVFANEENFCGQSGILEESFLGPNAIIANHATDCAIGVGSTYAHGYKHEGGTDHQIKPGCYVYVVAEDGIRDVYIARAPGDSNGNATQWGRLISTRPGTDDGVWTFYQRDPNPGVNTASWYAKEWLPNQPRGTYVWAAPLLVQGVNNFSGTLQCYNEGSQPPDQYLNPHGVHRGNLQGNGVLRGSMGDIGDGLTQMGSRNLQLDYYDEQAKRWEWIRITLAAIENGMVTPFKLESSRWGDGFTPKLAIEGRDLVTRFNNNAEGRVAAMAGPGSTIAVDGSGRPFELGTQLLGRLAIATTYNPGAWLGHRIVFRQLHEIPGENSMFEELGVGDWVLPARPNNPADPFDDNAAMSPEGWAGSVITNAPLGRGPKQFIRFGKLDDVVSGSLPPPPPPPDPNADSWSTTVHSSGIAISSDGLTADKTANGQAPVSGRATLAHGGGVRRFRVTVAMVWNVGIGLANDQWTPPTNYLGLSGNAIAFTNDGEIVDQAGVTAHVTPPAFTNGSVVDVEVSSTQIAYIVNGVEVLRLNHGLTGDLYPAYNLYSSGDSVTLDLSPPNLPTGVLAWDAP